MIEIHESYKSFVPPPWFRPTVERLLMSLPLEHVGGLKSVILTDSASIGRGKTHRVAGRKYYRNTCLGFYHRQWRGQPAWVQLVTDNIVGGCPASLLRLQLFRDLEVGKTLYHEVGHHMHVTVGSAGRGGEETAEYWRKRLSRIHFRRRYWYLRPVVVALETPVRFLRRFAPIRPHAKTGEAGLQNVTDAKPRKGNVKLSQVSSGSRLNVKH